MSPIAPLDARPFYSLPIRWGYHKLSLLAERVTRAVCGYFLRIIAFQKAEAHSRFSRLVLRIHQWILSDAEIDNLRPRPELFSKMGAQEFILNLPLTARYAVFESKLFFEQLSSERAICKEVYYLGKMRKMLFNAPAWIKEVGLPEIHVMDFDSPRKTALLLPDPPKKNGHPIPLIFHCHASDRTMDQETPLICMHLLAGYDFAVWDPGSQEPSEGGYYLDGEAVFKEVENLYPNKPIYLSASRDGTFTAAHLKKIHHAKGIQLIAHNPYSSLQDVVERHYFFGHMLFHYGKEALHYRYGQVEENHFDVVAKLRHLPYSAGRFIFTYTPRFVQEKDKLSHAVSPAGAVSPIVNPFTPIAQAQSPPLADPITPIRRPPGNIANLQLPFYRDPDCWERYVEVVT